AHAGRQGGGRQEPRQERRQQREDERGECPGVIVHRSLRDITRGERCGGGNSGSKKSIPDPTGEKREACPAFRDSRGYARCPAILLPGASCGGGCGGSAERSGGPRRGRIAAVAAQRHGGSVAAVPPRRGGRFPPRALPARSDTVARSREPERRPAPR